MMYRACNHGNNRNHTQQSWR